jgi:hypothetical protein
MSIIERHYTLTRTWSCLPWTECTLCTLLLPFVSYVHAILLDVHAILLDAAHAVMRSGLLHLTFPSLILFEPLRGLRNELVSVPCMQKQQHVVGWRGTHAAEHRCTARVPKGGRISSCLPY